MPSSCAPRPCKPDFHPYPAVKSLLLLPLLLGTAAARPDSAPMEALPMGEKERAELIRRAEAQKATDMPVVRNAEELHALLRRSADALQSDIPFQLAGALQIDQLQSLVGSSPIRYEITGFSSVVERNSRRVLLHAEYHDGTKLRAAHRRPELKKTKLTDAERRTLADIEQRVARLCRNGMSDYEKLLALHDDLILRSRYVTDDATLGGSIVHLCRTGTGLCAAYTRTLQLELDIAGIPNLVIEGDSGGSHTWNLVKIEGEWRHVDATWDDPTVPRGEESLLLHEYFCLSDADMAHDHAWSKKGLPPVTKDKPLYLTRNGLYFGAHDYAALFRAAERAAAQGATQFSAYMADYDSVSRLNKEAERYMERGGKLRFESVSAPRNRSRGTVTLHFTAQ